VKENSSYRYFRLCVSAALVGYLCVSETSSALEPGNPAGTNAPMPAGIVLIKGWDSAMSDGVVTMKELRDLLSGFATAAPNTGPAPGIEIYKGIRYLMPLKDAVKTLGLGQEVNSKLLVACPGFPFNSLFGFSFHGSFEDGFDTVYFVTDGARQVVAVEFTNVSTKKIKLDTPLTDKAWVTFDFINTRVKGQPEAFVRHGTHANGEVLKIESVFVNPDGQRNSMNYRRPFISQPSGNYPFRYGGGTEMHPTRLYLPRPLAELILYRISKSGISNDDRKATRDIRE
jgi:hypothetical protein